MEWRCLMGLWRRLMMSRSNYVVLLLMTMMMLLRKGADAGTVQRRSGDQVDPVDYLTNFGYLPKANMETGAMRSDADLKNAVRQFQEMAGLPINGNMRDPRVIKKMKEPRCGALDYDASGPQNFVLGSSKWDKNELTYSILNYSPDLDRGATRESVAKALSMWSEQSSLTFREISSGTADIRISFSRWDHGDGYAFDGQGQVLAHAFPPGPERGGDAHFDDDEFWTVNTQQGTNLFTVAAHEFGHSLGILHSRTTGALMYPWYQGYNRDLKLSPDDIEAIRSLYPRGAAKPTPKPAVTRPPVTNKPTSKPLGDSRPDTCNTDIDAITVVRGQVFAFKGQWFWRLDHDGGLMDGYPVKISNFWKGFPKDLDGIDAVYERPEDKMIIFFRGRRYWEFNANELARGFPQAGQSLTTLGLPDRVDHIDGAMVWGFNKKTYLFSGYEYWRMNNITGRRTETGYPRALDMWRGIPVPLDAAFTHTDGATYFFKGNKCWKLNDKTMRADTDYPKNIGAMWLNCPDNLRSSALSMTSSASTIIIIIIAAVVVVLLSTVCLERS